MDLKLVPVLTLLVLAFFAGCVDVPAEAPVPEGQPESYAPAPVLAPAEPEPVSDYEEPAFEEQVLSEPEEEPVFEEYAPPENQKATLKFSIDKEGTKALSGDVYYGGLWGGEFLGTLENGEITLEKGMLLTMLDDEKIFHLHTKFNNRFFDACGWQLSEEELESKFYHTLYLESQDMQKEFRTAPCTTRLQFITPEDPAVKAWVAENVPDMSDNEDDDVNKIFRKFSDEIMPVEDSNRYDVDDWWFFPSEILKNRQGDDEDWNNALISVIKSRVPDANCYVVAMKLNLRDGTTYDKGSLFTTVCNIRNRPRIYIYTLEYTEERMLKDFLTLIQQFQLGEGYAGVKDYEPWAMWDEDEVVELEGKQDFLDRFGITARE